MRGTPHKLNAPRLTSRFATAAAVGVVAALLVIVIPAIAAKPAHVFGTAHSGHHGKVIHVVEHAITDFEAQGASGADVKGNVLVFNNPVFNTANAKQVGHDEGFCTRIQPQQHIWECLWTTFLKAGQITVQGPYYDNRNSILSITGGTAAYKTSRGQMNLNSRDAGKQYDFIFHLS